jgi:hypothetical protein
MAGMMPMGAWLAREELAVVVLLLATTTIFLFCALLFGSLPIRDEGEWLALRYGPLPIIRKRFRYADNTAVEPGPSALSPHAAPRAPASCLPAADAIDFSWARNSIVLGRGWHMNAAETFARASHLLCKSLGEALRRSMSVAVVRGLAGNMLLLALPFPAAAQIEVYHPGETYDSLQAGHDAYVNAEAVRRAAIGRQLQLQEQIQRDNTWANSADKYSPIRPESFGPILPRAVAGIGREEIYALPRPDRQAYQDRPGLPLFEPWPRVPNDIFSAPYYGVVRQPTGYVKIWTGPQSCIYKPTYASPPMDMHPSPPVAAGLSPGQLRSGIAGSQRTLPGPTAGTPPAATYRPSAAIPPPPKPMLGLQSVPAPAPPAGAAQSPTAREL